MRPPLAGRPHRDGLADALLGELLHRERGLLVDEARAGQDRLAAAGQQVVLGVLGDDEDAQVALQVLLLVDGEQDRARRRSRSAPPATGRTSPAGSDRCPRGQRVPARRRSDPASGCRRRSDRPGWPPRSRFCAPVGSARSTATTSDGTPPRPSAKPSQRWSSAWLPTSWLTQSVFVTPASAMRCAGPLARDELGLAHVGQDAELLVGVDARVDAHDRDPGILGALDRVSEALRGPGSRSRAHRARPPRPCRSAAPWRPCRRSPGRDS